MDNLEKIEKIPTDLKADVIVNDYHKTSSVDVKMDIPTAIQNLTNLFSQYELLLPYTDSLETFEIAIDALKNKLTIEEYKNDLIKWLLGEKYIFVDETSMTMTEEFENEHQWHLSRNCFINKIINHINGNI